MMVEHMKRGVGGIVNPGCVCYITCVLQLLYHCQFREVLKNSENKESGESSEGDGEVISLLKELFVLMDEQSLQVDAIDVTKILTSLAKDVNFRSISLDEEQDMFQYFSTLFQLIKNQNNETYLQCFKGINQSYLLKSDMETPDIREQSFNFLSLNTRTKQLDQTSELDLLSSLTQYFQKESFISNGQSLEKSLKLISPPKVLILHLRRFDFDKTVRTTVKLNHRFTFPLQFDLQPYLCSHEDINNNNSKDNHGACEYSLSGIIVHKGTAHAGHYYSIIRHKGCKGKEEWVKLNDEKASEFNIDNLSDAAFGGEENNDENAMLLVYEASA